MLVRASMCCPSVVVEEIMEAIFNVLPGVLDIVIEVLGGSPPTRPSCSRKMAKC